MGRGGRVTDWQTVVAEALGPRARLGEPLGARTTYRVGGPAAVLVTVSGEDDLVLLRDALRRAGAEGRVPLLVLGKGSNLLVSDAGFDGVVVCLGKPFELVELPEPGGAPVVRAGGGCGLPVLARRTVEAGLRGLEWAVGVPGSVGGALRMNAGGHGSDVAATLRRYRWVDLLEPRQGEDDAASLHLGYRTSALTDSQVVVWAEFGLRPGDPAEGRAEIAEIVRWRRQHQPGGSNAGSVFTNPRGDSAGRLVDASGLKGFRLGSARVSEKHANFIQADDGGSADDVARLIEHVRAEVAHRCGVELVPEVHLVGFSSGETGR